MRRPAWSRLIGAKSTSDDRETSGPPAADIPMFPGRGNPRLFRAWMPDGRRWGQAPGPNILPVLRSMSAIRPGSCPHLLRDRPRETDRARDHPRRRGRRAIASDRLTSSRGDGVSSIFPSFMTKKTRSVAVISAVGSPGMAMTSAIFPGSRVPTLAAIPSNSALTEVADLRASTGDIPSPVIRANSLALIPWGETAESVPKPIRTPSRTAVRNISERAASAALALAAISGGYFSSLPPIQSAARRVGTRNVPRAFISASVSSPRNEPCSIESTPARMASRAARSPWQWAATFLRSRWASSTRAFISSGVSCGVSTSSASDRTPPEAQNLITSAPYLTW